MFRLIISIFLTFYFASCINNYARLPSTVVEVNTNQDIQQSLMALAQNGIMVNIPEATTREYEKSEVDFRCRKVGSPLWSEKFVYYLKEFKKRPELLNKFSVLEIKRADKSGIVIQKDLDGAITISIQFVKMESYNKITPQTKIPCSGSVVEYLGRDLIETKYEFPSLDKLVLAIRDMPEKKEIPRFQFSTHFLTFLAERGVLLRFNHDFSFEKTSDGKFVMAELMNKFSEEVKQPQFQYINYWIKKINAESTQARFIQMFSVIEDKELKAGVRVDLKNDTASRATGESDLTYLFVSYYVEDNQISSVGIPQLDKCLEEFTKVMNSIQFRKPAANDKESYLRPGYSCVIK